MAVDAQGDTWLTGEVTEELFGTSYARILRIPAK
jgi:hypothetical protein